MIMSFVLIINGSLNFNKIGFSVYCLFESVVANYTILLLFFCSLLLLSLFQLLYHLNKK